MGRLSRNVLLLAAASLLADVSGEMLMAVLPFLLVAQGGGGLAVGLVAGAADAVGHLLKPVAGAVADRTRRRKPLVVGGYLVAAVSRVGIALSASWPVSLLFRAGDRVGKGLRTAPRDALLAESAPAAERGRAFGLHRAADTLGAFLGVALALGMLALWGATPATVVLVGAAAGLLTVVPLAFVRETDAAPRAGRRAFGPASPGYRRFLLVAGLFAMGNVSYMFFLLRARDAVGGDAPAVALYLLFNAVYAAAAYPIGRASDRIGRPRVLVAGFALFAAGAALFLPAPSAPLAVAGFVLLGLSYACVDATERALAADLAGSAARGTRLGLLSGVVGLAGLAGGLVAGALWDAVGPWATFAWGIGVAAAALAALAGSGLLRGRAAPG